ncbi:MAG: hypothetical protein GY696_07170 [Gammaproteobacteria bacterium]|nr:hypothetical protein [Gammaproteobacteria bacterium]
MEKTWDSEKKKAVACGEITFSENGAERTQEHTVKPEAETLSKPEELKPFKPEQGAMAQEGEKSLPLPPAQMSTTNLKLKLTNVVGYRNLGQQLNLGLNFCR